MDLGAFLADQSFGDWADEEVDMSSIGVPTSSTAVSLSNYRPDFGSYDSTRPDRVEYPLPDAPPYKARVTNLPYDVEVDALGRFFEDRLQAKNIVEDVKLPMDQMSGRPKGFAFITFTEKAVLQEALNLTMSDFNGRKIYVNVAAPQKADVFDMDWRSGRTGPMSGREPRERREDVELDWGAARASSGPTPPRDRGYRGDRGMRGGDREFGERRPRREELELDWGAVRGSAAPMPPRERKPRREEPELDWALARTGAPLPPKERDGCRREGRARKDQSDSDWASARGSGSGAGIGAGANFRKKEEKEFDWKRGQTLPPKSHNKATKMDDKKDDREKDQVIPQKPPCYVLPVEDGDPDAEAEAETNDAKETNDTKETKEAQETGSKETGLEKKAADTSVSDEDWKTVGR